MNRRQTLRALTPSLFLFTPDTATADDVKVVSVTATGLMKAFEILAPAFERATGHVLSSISISRQRFASMSKAAESSAS